MCISIGLVVTMYITALISVEQYCSCSQNKKVSTLLFLIWYGGGLKKYSLFSLFLVVSDNLVKIMETVN
jgi:hypothetical protein